MFNWHKKEKPFLGYGGFGGVSTGLAFGGAASSAVKATGGTVVEPGNGYVYHVFTSSGAIVADAAPVPNVDWLIVAGGGAGGPYFGGGGGAGGYRVKSNSNPPLNSPAILNLTPTPISVTVGDGATSGGTQGSPSSLGPLSASGGGGGKVGGGGAGGGTNGGSGGGGGSTNSGGNTAGTSGNQGGYNPPEGQDGAMGYHTGNYPAGGGGGAGGTGNTPGSTTGPGGPGGNGHPNPDFAAPHVAPALTAAGVPGPQVTAFTNAVGPTGLYAGGGGGAATGSQGTGGPGGGGGGGNSPGVEYTGGGGAGQWPPAGGSAGYDGGKGIVIVRYAE